MVIVTNTSKITPGNAHRTFSLIQTNHKKRLRRPLSAESLFM
ncbi:UNVERIFIED_CONTAM: hypothetical protein ABIC26_002078 [Paenibacillus sp. PvR008]